MARVRQAVKYGWKNGRKPEDAEAFGKVMDAIPPGERTPAAVVAKARPKSSPIHKLFEWDDTAAAEKYRCEQARQYTRELTVTVISDGKELPTRAFHSIVIEHEADAENQGHRFFSVDEIKGDKALEEQVVAQALKELNGWRQRYADYSKIFGGVFAAIDKAAEKVEGNGKPARRRQAAVA